MKRVTALLFLTILWLAPALAAETPLKIINVAVPREKMLGGNARTLFGI